MWTASSAAAQQQNQESQQEAFRLKVAVDVVNVDVTVTDAKGNFVRGLQRANFRVLDERAEVPLTNFASVESPAIVLLLVESSPAVYLIHRQHMQAANALLAGLAADDWVGLATYAEKLRVVQTLTRDKSEVQAGLGASGFGMGSAQLNLFESVDQALDLMATIPGKKTLVLLSTGLDAAGPEKWDALERKLAASETTIYAVALGGDLRDYRASKTAAGEESNPLSFEKADRVLKEMAGITGGAAFFPRSRDDLRAIYRQVATTIRHRYSLAFKPATRDGKFHNIYVQLLDDKGRVLGPFYGLDPSEPKPSSTHRKNKYRLNFRRGYVAIAP
jgi:VWFA-related protein